MNKKLISVLLSVVMIITTVFGGMSVSAEGVTNYVGDGGFENADFSGTVLNFGTGGATQTQTWGRFSSGVTRMETVTADNYGPEDSLAVNGNKYMKSGVTADGNYIRGFGQILDLPAGDYVLTFIAKSDAGNLFSAGVYNTSVSSIAINNSIAYTYLEATDYWKEYKVGFTVSTAGKYHLMFGGNTGGDQNIRLFYLDNVAVYAKNSIVNINANATAGGTVTGGGVVANGDTVTLTATAKSGYSFTGWSDGETAATRTFTATADVSYTANFEKLAADFVPNGDFEADDWALSDYWTTLSGNNAFAEVADPEDATNTVAYAKGAAAATTMLSKNTITLKDGHTYFIRFDFFMANTVSGNGTNFYRAGFLKPGSANLGGANFYGAFADIYGITTSTSRGTWYKGYGYKYTHSGADVEANIVLGMYNNECTSDFYVDNIIAYDEADLCEFSVTADKGGVVEGGVKQYYFTGEELTLTAVAKSGFEFAGWSDGEASATRTVTVTAGANYHALFTGLASDNLVLNGDFEAEDWKVADAWGTVATNDKVFQKGTEENGNNYAAAVPNQRNSLASDVITVKPGEKYVIEFDYYFVDSGANLTGDINGFYRYGFIEASQTGLGGSAFTALAGNNYGAFAPALQKDDWFGIWQHMAISYTNTGTTDVQVKAIIGYYNDECGYEWRVDNVRIYNQANSLIITANAENGSATMSYETAYILKGDKVTLTATPNEEGYEFLGWFANGGTDPVSTSEVYTVTVTESTTFTAKYKAVVPPVYGVVNGDFEKNENVDFTTNITGTDNEGVWARVGTGVNMFTYATATVADPDYVGNGYAVATVPAEGYVRTFGQFITLKANTDYVLEFIAKSNVLTSGENPYSPVFGAVIKRMSGSHGIQPGGDTKNIVDDNAYVTVKADGEWNRYTVRFNSGSNTKVAVAFGGNTMATAGMSFAVDNVVLYESKTSVINNFENGSDSWTATNGATVTTANTKDTALASFTKYVGNKLGVLNPAAEGDVFTSPAFATEAGKTYDVVIYTRHNSADDTRGKFTFTANGENENLSVALYGRPVDESDIGKYENDDGFMVNPIVMGGDATYDSGTFTKLIFTFTATAEAHNIAITAVNPVSAFIDGFELYCHEDSVELAENSISYKGTAIRTTGEQGLRFKNSISVDALAHLGNYAKVVAYGTLAIKEEYKNGEITVENLTDGTYEYTKSSGAVGCRLKAGVAYKAEDGTDVVFDSNIYNKDFTGVLIGITEENYTANYVTRAYAKIQFANGSFTYVYGDEQTANVYAVAEYIVNNGLETDEIRDYLSTIILGK